MFWYFFRTRGLSSKSVGRGVEGSRSRESRGTSGGVWPGRDSLPITRTISAHAWRSSAMGGQRRRLGLPSPWHQEPVEFATTSGRTCWSEGSTERRKPSSALRSDSSRPPTPSRISGSSSSSSEERNRHFASSGERSRSIPGTLARKRISPPRSRKIAEVRSGPGPVGPFDRGLRPTLPAPPDTSMEQLVED